MRQMEKNNNKNNNSSPSLVFGRGQQPLKILYEGIQSKQFRKVPISC